MTTRSAERSFRVWLIPGIVTTVIALLVLGFDAPVVLATVCALGLALPLLLWPQLSVVLVIFVLYANLSVIAYKIHGAPQLLAGAVILPLGLPLIHYLVIRRERPRVDAAFLWMVGLLAVFLLSALFARDAGVAGRRIQMYVLEGLLLYWLVLNVIRSWATLRRVIWAVLAAGSMLAGLSLYQATTGNYSQNFAGLALRNERFLPGSAKAIASSQTADAAFHLADRAGGPLGGNGEPNRYAQILIVLLPLALFCFRTSPVRRVRFAALAAGGLILGGVILSYSRGAFLTLGLLLIAMTMVRWMRPTHVLVGALALLLLVPVFAPGYTARIASIETAADLLGDRQSIEADGSIRGRATEMLAALNVAIDHPILGVGPGQYLPFYSADYQQNNAISFRDLDSQRRAHTLYFEMAAEAGVIGLGVFLMIFFSLLHGLWRLRRQTLITQPVIAELATAFCLSIMAYLGTGIFLHLAYERYLWLLLALAGATLQVARDYVPAAERDRYAWG